MDSEKSISSYTITVTDNTSGYSTHSLQNMEDSYCVNSNIILHPNLSIKKDGNAYILKANGLDIYLTEDMLIDLIVKSELALK